MHHRYTHPARNFPGQPDPSLIISLSLSLFLLSFPAFRRHAPRLLSFLSVRNQSDESHP